jgi:hypothetical protein
VKKLVWLSGLSSTIISLHDVYCFVKFVLGSFVMFAQENKTNRSNASNIVYQEIRQLNFSFSLGKNGITDKQLVKYFT